ncbi:MAG: phosphoglycerate dehydrogenase [Paenibacillus dendritiformis]|uniref:phosphoglycerate dehydrogenase n=1 Tax=Paenibacillus dendritiformis TaxID=130049 RepID=UPI001B2EB444|nr:phosphoglycerate dehydrogenase [Paenibacillus dendritiformis]MDU5142677.1 phosphoglycerate dehydrogenase [Paenibacillus dendritiformis]GIO70844.1 phosphoglycerate dehydrogenase [Paenibacillus dendritiformis]
MFKVLVSDPISDFGIQQLVDAQDVTVLKKTGLSEDELIDIIGDVDALLVRSQTRVTARIMEAAKQLKVIGRAGVGVDNIDLEAATKRGIIVINAPDGNTITTCEHAFAMMMALSRHIPQAYVKTIGGVWDRKSFLGVELMNKTLGVLGMGRIGSEVAKRAKAFGMEVIGYDPFMTDERAEKLGVKLGTVDEIIRAADFITVHTPLTDETRHMISRPQFEVMKRGMRIINCARGGIIDERALIEAIDEGIVAGAAFDVFEAEPPAADHPFLHHPNIIVTPHLGASTVEAQENVAVDVSEQVLHILRNEPFKNAVNMPPVAPSVLKKIQPYFKLAEKLGQFAGQMAKSPVLEIVVNYCGDLAEVDTQPITRYIVKGVLSRHLGSDVNEVNSMHLAKVRDINILVEKSHIAKGFTNLLTVKLRTSTEERLVAGTLLNGYGERIVQIDKYTVDLVPEGYLLLISHHDKPGVIGLVGSLLGNNGVNIATMQVGRKIAGGDAIMVLSVDKSVPQDVLAELKAHADINKAKVIVL